MAEPLPEGVSVPLVWIDPEEAAPLAANQFLGQISGIDEFLVSFGHVAPPPLHGSPEDRLAQGLRLVSLLLEGRTRVMPAIRGTSESGIDFDDIRTENSVDSGLAELANRLDA